MSGASLLAPMNTACSFHPKTIHSLRPLKNHVCPPITPAQMPITSVWPVLLMEQPPPAHFPRTLVSGSSDIST